MAYFGNTPIQSTYLTDYFSGDGSTVAFTLSRAPIAASSVIITISGVKQAASTYGVSGTTLTFSEAPPTGTNNIEVLHLGISPETVTLPSYRTVTEFTATAGQTTFSPASYTAGYIDVYRNGVKLGADDFTATNGTTVVLDNACIAGDLVRFESFLITSFNNAIPNTAGAVGSSLIANTSITTDKLVDDAVTDDKLSLESNASNIKTALNASGSAPIYACRAWVNFNGTGTVAIRASGNVSSITDHGTGNYTVNFTTAMPDANYAWAAERSYRGHLNSDTTAGYVTSSSIRFITWEESNGAVYDPGYVVVTIFR